MSTIPDSMSRRYARSAGLALAALATLSLLPFAAGAQPHESVDFYRSRTLKLIDQASDVASLKNLQDIKGPLDKFLGPLNKVASLTAERSLVGAGTKYEWLGKAGLARGLGWAGVGFSAYDSVQSFAKGDIEGGLGSAFKAGLGVGSFLPPPAGTVCQVASVGIAVYENWDTISRVGKDVGEGIVNAVKDPGKFVSDTASNIKDAGESVAKFFSFGD